MASASEAINRLRFEVTTTGTEQSAAQLGRVAAGQAAVATSAATAGRSMAGYEAQVAAIQKRQEAYTAAITANTAALTNSSGAMVAANDNAAKSFTIAGIEAASLANNVKLAAEAAYAFSPAFRGVVNGLAAPALRGASVALVAVAGGIVTATNLAGSGLVRLGAAAASVAPSFGPVAAGITSAGVAMQAFSPSLGAVATSILSKLAPAISFVLGPVLLVYHAVSLMTEAWRLGGEELDRYRKIAEDAAKVDLSTTYFQKLTKGAENAKVPVDALTAALTTLQKTSADQLGGSALQNRLDASVKAGNFSGNSGVQQYAQANTTQQRYEAIVSLINQAMTAGQRLAALDIAGTAFGPQAVENLRKDSEYFDKINAAAANVPDTTIVSPEDVGRALDLQTRYDAAVKILETRWHPVQDLLTKAGIEFHANWVATVETIAQAFDWVAKMVAKLGDVPSWFQKKLNEGGQLITDATTTPESRKAAEASYGISSDPAEMAKGTDAYSTAVNKLRAGLQDQAEQQRKVAEANTIAQKTLGDTSHTIDNAAKATQGQADAYDRAYEGLTKHIARQQADTQAVGLGAGALEEFRARATLLNAAQVAGRPVTAELTAEIEKQAKAAGAAGEALAKMRINDQIRFDRATIGLSAEDVQIATQLRGIYPDVATALNSTEAAQMRLNAQMREAKDITVGFGNDMVFSFLRGESGLKSMTAAATNLVAKLASANVSRLLQGGSIFGTQSLMSGAGALGVASAGMAGYQSGSMLTGALGGAMAGATFGPVGAVVGGVAGLLGGLFGGNSQKKQQEEQERKQAEAAAAQAAAAVQQRVQNLDARLQLAVIDTSTHLGAMQALEVQFQQERLAEAQNGGQAMSQLVMAQDAERLATEKKYQEEQAKAEQAALDASLKRMQGFRDRLEAASADTSTLGGALADYEYKAAQERAAEVEADGQAMNDLVAAQESERYNIYKKFNDASLEAAKKTAEELQSFVQGVVKNIAAYLQGLKTGSSSILSPQAQLGAAQSNFNAQLILAQGGNRDALSGITTVAQTLLDQAKSFYASSSGYSNIYDAVTAALQGLTGISPATVASADAQAIVAAVNSATGAVNTTGASNDNLTAAQSALVAAQNALAAQQVSYLQTQGSLLTAIQGLLGQMVSLNSTSSQQLALLNAQYAAQPFSVAAGGGIVTINNTMIAALNKIVLNTWATAANTSGGNHYLGTLATGGWITGGTPGKDSVMLASGNALGMPGEFVVRHDIAQANKAWLPEFNATGRLPAVPNMQGFRAPNDNVRTSPTNFDWQGLARAIKQISDMSDERASDKSDELTAAIDQLPAKLAAEIRRLLAGTKQRAA